MSRYIYIYVCMHISSSLGCFITWSSPNYLKCIKLASCTKHRKHAKRAYSAPVLTLPPSTMRLLQTVLAGRSVAFGDTTPSCRTRRTLLRSSLRTLLATAACLTHPLALVWELAQVPGPPASTNVIMEFAEEQHFLLMPARRQFIQN